MLTPLDSAASAKQTRHPELEKTEPFPSSWKALRGGISGEGIGNPLQYSCLENPMDRGAWQTTDHGVARVGHGLATKLLLRGDMEGHGTPAGAGGSSQLPTAVRPLREEGPSSFIITLSSLPPFC